MPLKKIAERIGESPDDIVEMHPLVYSVYNADFYLPKSRLAIEVNGPSHYLFEYKDGVISWEQKRLNGKTVDKLRTL